MLNMDTLRSELKPLTELITSEKKIEVEDRLVDVRCSRTIGIICIVTAVVCAVIALIGMSMVLLPIIFGCAAFVSAGVGIGLLVHGEVVAKKVKVFIESLKNNKDQEVDGVSQKGEVSPEVMKCSEQVMQNYRENLRNPRLTILDCVIYERDELCEEDQIHLWGERVKANTPGVANLLEEDLYVDLSVLHDIGHKSMEEKRKYCKNIYGKLENFDSAFERAYYRYSSTLYKQ